MMRKRKAGYDCGDSQSRKRLKTAPAVQEYWRGEPLPSLEYNIERVLHADGSDWRVCYRKHKPEKGRGPMFGPDRYYDVNGFLWGIDYYDKGTCDAVMCIYFKLVGNESVITRFEERLDCKTYFHGVTLLYDRLNNPSKSGYRYGWFGKEMTKFTFSQDVYEPIQNSILFETNLLNVLNDIVMEYLFLKES